VKAQAEAFNSKFDGMIEWVKRSFPSFDPTVTINDQGQPELSFGLGTRDVPRAALKTVIQASARAAADKNKIVVVVFDEFQQLLSYEDDQVVKQLRSTIQEHRDVSYIFLGSRKHLISSMLVDKQQPLYGSGAHYLLNSIAYEHWQPFIEERFKSTHKMILPGLIEQLCASTQGHPYYVQHLCHVLWDMTQEGETADEALLQESIETLMNHQSYAFEMLWESLTQMQKRFLEGVAVERSGVHVFSQEFVNKYGLKRASNAQVAAEKLLQRDLIDRESHSFLITDRFFRLWIRRLSNEISLRE